MTTNVKLENKSINDHLMGSSEIYLGNTKATFNSKEIKSELVSFYNEQYFKISNYDQMRPFFMSIVSDSNHWMFISSTGGLSAGRKDSDSALFPYYTDDKISESSEFTGSKTLIQVKTIDRLYHWEPFSRQYQGVYSIQRNLFKSIRGNKIIFEEINHDLGLTFRYQWSSSNLYGFVKRSTLLNNTDEVKSVRVLDGIQNILPYGVGEFLQNTYSNLVDAYKKNELEKDTGMGIFALSAIIVDKAEPSEALKSTIAWSTGLKNPQYLISSLQLNNFRKGIALEAEIDVRAERGAYFTCTNHDLQPTSSKSWFTIANVNQSVSDIALVSELIKKEGDLETIIQKDIDLGTKRLIELNGAADGIQLTSDRLRNTRHFSNTLFNIMRGGIFDDNYTIEKKDFLEYIYNANKKVFKKKENLLNTLSETFSVQYLQNIYDTNPKHNEDRNFRRLCIEYLPLKFSRRHGDPSRPWNKFSINTRSEVDGSKILDYQGNWRDIFQNWEALVHSYPEFIEGMIHKFLNATTFDGYNPYRVTKDGFDWETIEPNDPWSYIGYWGDHQIIYLLKFLEFSEDHYPNHLASYLDQEIFVYANVPYRIKPYSDILLNPKDTIDFDADAEKRILQKREELGADGALLRDRNFFIYKVNLIEKLLATTLAKIANFIPEAGIWMNTQRPEWNDANNALVGNGVSMVTLYYLRRFLKFLESMVENSAMDNFSVSTELVQCFHKMQNTLQKNEHLLSTSFSDAERKVVLDGLGQAASDYRSHIYDHSFSSDKDAIVKTDLLQFIGLTMSFLEHSIRANKRDDNLFHAYNLITINRDALTISRLPEMLEGQVAVLSAGYLSASESLDILNALKKSALFRPDQYSYILYPNKELPRFLNKNNIPKEKIESNALVQQLLHDGDRSIIEKDLNGDYHFNGGFNNADSLKQALAKLPKERYGSLIQNNKEKLLAVFEEMFDHKSFTGRSGTFFGFEGLGSIYWHMVSKLLLSVQETCLAAVKSKENPKIIGGLLDHYYEIHAGIGVYKSPELYGAFTIDPYSHTPLNKGAQQPGMTGQVKEDIICRFGELGVFVEKGHLSFNPCLLRKTEFLKKEQHFNYVDVHQNHKTLSLSKGSLAFTYCQVPIIYQSADRNKIEIFDKNNSGRNHEGLTLDEKTSHDIFKRTGEITLLKVSIDNKILK